MRRFAFHQMKIITEHASAKRHNGPYTIRMDEDLGSGKAVFDQEIEELMCRGSIKITY